MEASTLKERLKGEGALLGIFNGMQGAYAAEIVAGAGYDWICIDGEHAPFDLPGILHQLQSMSRFDSHVVVRPPGHDLAYIKQLLDIGVQNLLVPMVESSEQAAAIEKVLAYPPKGRRGVGTGIARAAQWNRVGDYLTNAAQNLTLMIQIESKLGLENLDSICKTSGADVIFVGPADLSASLGRLGEQDDPEMVELIAGIIARIVQHGKTAGVMTLNKVNHQTYLDAGARVVAVAVDTLILAQGADRLLNDFKSGQST